MYETIYELSPDKLYFPIDTIMCFFMGVGLLINGIDQFKKMKVSGKRILKKTFHIFWITLGVVGVAFFIPAGINSISYGGSDNAYYAEIYDSGKYKIVEGAVDEYFDGGKWESFSVTGIDFKVARSEYRPLKKFKVGGEFVKICYINTDIGNRILKLEILRE